MLEDLLVIHHRRELVEQVLLYTLVLQRQVHQYSSSTGETQVGWI